ncbi:MAG: DUF6677 family protein [Planctomycetota bacterium]
MNDEQRKPPALIVPDPLAEMRARGKSPELAGLLAWLIPGAGHIYAGYPIKGLGALVLILGLFVAGVGISRGECVSLREPGGHRFAFVGQIGAGLPTFAALAYNHDKLPGLHPGFLELVDAPGGVQAPAYAAQLPRNDTGLLFTMIAGLLNLLLVHDAMSGVPGAINRRIMEERRRRRLEKLRAELGAEAAAAAPAAEPAAAGPADGEATEPTSDAAPADAPPADEAAPVPSAEPAEAQQGGEP